MPILTVHITKNYAPRDALVQIGQNVVMSEDGVAILVEREGTHLLRVTPLTGRGVVQKIEIVADMVVNIEL